MFLQGELTRLRPFEIEDAATMVKWINDPAVHQYVGAPDFQWSLPAEEDFVREASPNDWEHGINLAIEATDTGDGPVLIGNIALHDLQPVFRHATLGVQIGERDYWSHGYGTDAVRTLCRFGFEELDLHRIDLTVAEFNPRGLRAYEKVGFVVEGRLRQDRYVRGRYYDTLMMGLLREEFEAREAARAEPVDGH
jgi:RimJ/RimL family protein N-acetyltransferase